MGEIEIKAFGKFSFDIKEGELICILDPVKQFV